MDYCISFNFLTGESCNQAVSNYHTSLCETHQQLQSYMLNINTPAEYFYMMSLSKQSAGDSKDPFVQPSAGGCQ